MCNLMIVLTKISHSAERVTLDIGITLGACSPTLGSEKPLTIAVFFGSDRTCERGRPLDKAQAAHDQPCASLDAAPLSSKHDNE